MKALDTDASRPARALLAWYRANRRALPWRENGDPYRVLVSEIMLQQTRVETVLSYYQRFISAFPDVETLAAATMDEVLAKWSGLGYYSRARRLHAAARAIVERGEFPRTETELLELPGVGAYTAAAIASIAFGEPVAVVDGNVERVIARLLALEVDPAQGQAKRLVREAASRLLVRDAAGDSNQALMELGAMICLPHRPRCLVCPLLEDCAARASGRVEELPVRAPRRQGVVQRRVVAVARRGDRFLLARNSDRSELLAGVWEFPWTSRTASREEWEAGLARSYGGEWSLGDVRGSARHAITFRSLELEIRDAEVRFDGEAVADGESRPEPGWFSVEEIAAVPTTSMVRKVLAFVAPLSAPKTR
ncbi:MAG TPA: A/G-specific adenine glycosylase [Thermoanaerobaculia bacterium]|nr:A/G-specific adenine glycosylase [Thermoanaerobaculia bacterium]